MPLPMFQKKASLLSIARWYAIAGLYVLFWHIHFGLEEMYIYPLFHLTGFAVNGLIGLSLSYSSCSTIFLTPLAQVPLSSMTRNSVTVSSTVFRNLTLKHRSKLATRKSVNGLNTVDCNLPLKHRSVLATHNYGIVSTIESELSLKYRSDLTALSFGLVRSKRENLVKAAVSKYGGCWRQP